MDSNKEGCYGGTMIGPSSDIMIVMHCRRNAEEDKESTKSTHDQAVA